MEKAPRKIEAILQQVKEGTVNQGAGASKNGGRRPPFLRVLINEMKTFCFRFFVFVRAAAREAEYEGEIDPHTPLFINITYTKKRPSFRQNSWCAKGRMVPWLGVLIKVNEGKWRRKVACSAL